MRHRINSAQIKQLGAVAREARYLRGARQDVEKALQAGIALTDEQIRGVKVFEERLFQELEQLEKMEDLG